MLDEVGSNIPSIFKLCVLKAIFTSIQTKFAQNLVVSITTTWPRWRKTFIKLKRLHHAVANRFYYQHFTWCRGNNEKTLTITQSCIVGVDKDR